MQNQRIQHQHCEKINRGVYDKIKNTVIYFRLTQLFIFISSFPPIRTGLFCVVRLEIVLASTSTPCSQLN